MGGAPGGSDVGKYLLGTAFRNGLRISDVLGGYADAVGADLGDVVFSARYTRIGFLLSFLVRTPDKNDRRDRAPAPRLGDRPLSVEPEYLPLPEGVDQLPVAEISLAADDIAHLLGRNPTKDSPSIARSLPWPWR